MTDEKMILFIENSETIHSKKDLCYSPRTNEVHPEPIKNAKSLSFKFVNTYSDQEVDRQKLAYDRSRKTRCPNSIFKHSPDDTDK